MGMPPLEVDTVVAVEHLPEYASGTIVSRKVVLGYSKRTPGVRVYMNQYKVEFADGSACLCHRSSLKVISAP